MLYVRRISSVLLFQLFGIDMCLHLLLLGPAGDADFHRGGFFDHSFDNCPDGREGPGGVNHVSFEQSRPIIVLHEVEYLFEYLGDLDLLRTAPWPRSVRPYLISTPSSPLSPAT